MTIVFEEMENVIQQLVTKSYADSAYDKVIKALQAYRTEAIDVSPLIQILLTTAWWATTL